MASSRPTSSSRRRPTARTLTEEEKRDAGDLGYRDLYRKLVTGMMTLRERGLPIYDLGDIFANEKGTIYADHVHYLRDAGRRKPRQSPDGDPHRRIAGRDLGAAEEALTAPAAPPPAGNN